MQRVLITGAAGGIGSRLRKFLRGVYPEIRWSDLKVPRSCAG
jgi:uronate dehydrogenase